MTFCGGISNTGMPRRERFSNPDTVWRWPEQTVALGPLSLLEAGQVEPFRSYPSALPEKVIGESMDYGESIPQVLLSQVIRTPISVRG